MTTFWIGLLIVMSMVNIIGSVYIRINDFKHLKNDFQELKDDYYDFKEKLIDRLARIETKLKERKGRS